MKQNPGEPLVSVVRYDYTYTDRGLRATGKQSGSAYGDYVEPTYYRYGYNGRGELTVARGYVGTDVTVTTKPMSGRQYQFGYDHIGNRTSANRTDVGALRESFMANSLNQIVQRDHHTVAVQGTARSDATVLVAGRVNGQPINSLAGRAGTYFGGEANLDNVDQPAYETVGIVAAVVGGGSGGADLITQTSSPAAFLPASPEHLAYDYEGNVTADGQWQYFRPLLSSYRFYETM